MLDHRHLDSMLVAIRAIVSFVTDQIYTLRNSNPDDLRLDFFESLLSETVTITRSVLSPVQLASLILGVGRQFEPHHFQHLFPLPFRSGDAKGYITIRDLFSFAVTHGTLSVAASSLPLFDKKEMLHQHCMSLLHHCITTLFKFVDPELITDLSCLQEEGLFMQQIFRYTIKLEDSNDAIEAD
jgi:hypothetical protein